VCRTEQVNCDVTKLANVRKNPRSKVNCIWQVNLWKEATIFLSLWVVVNDVDEKATGEVTRKIRK
jgi:hypothetical protein